MGLFNRNKKVPVQGIQPQQPVQKSNAEWKVRPDGRLQIDYYDPKADFKKFYDTTRLILGHSMNIADEEVIECLVSWYGESDCIFLGENEDESGRRGDYEKVLVQLDLKALQNDPVYLDRVMKDLLDQKRVQGYLQRGLQDSPQNPCGQYIGGVNPREYGKFFNARIGHIAHNLPEMRNKRERYKEMRRASKEKKIEELKRQLLELESDDPGGR